MIFSVNVRIEYDNKIITESIGDCEISIKIISILNKCIIKQINLSFYCFVYKFNR